MGPSVTRQEGAQVHFKPLDCHRRAWPVTPIWHRLHIFANIMTLASDREGRKLFFF